MNESDLKNKIIEWLNIRSEVQTLEKASATNLDASEKLNKNDYLKRMIQTIKASKQRKKDQELTDFKNKAPQPPLEHEPYKPPTLHDPDISGKVDYKKVKKTKAIPASVSDPTIMNRVDKSPPHNISGPTVINSYKSENSESSGKMMSMQDIVNVLKRKHSKE